MIGEVAWAFLRLGCTSFGGPIAHLGFFRSEFVEQRRWLDDEQYGDLVALCQFLPGPASSQVVFALGLRRAGLLGALVASLCFTLPSALVMVALGYGVAWRAEWAAAGWLHGLKLAAVAVVAQAVWAMGSKLCPDRSRVTLGVFSAAALLALPFAGAQVAVILVGAAVGAILYGRQAPPASGLASASSPPRRRWAAGALLVFALLLAGLPVLAAATGSRPLTVFDAFYRSGALVFGGGHVVLPLLWAEVVPNGWLDNERFLAGYAAAQALPGPLFTFAAYLGTAMEPGAPSWRNGLWCLLAIFLPAWLLIGGSLPFWERVRGMAAARAALAGANASVVGVLLAALYDPIFVTAVRAPSDLIVVLVAFVLLQQWKAPPWGVVFLAAATGQWLS